jgi:hypothetical protein
MIYFWNGGYLSGNGLISSMSPYLINFLEMKLYGIIIMDAEKMLLLN